MAIPESSPLRSEKVITLLMSGAREGSRKPLKPSSSPSAPPTASPRIGFVMLIEDSSCDAACEPAAPSLGIRVRLHHAEEIAFRILKVGEIADRGNRGFGHDQLSAQALDGFHGVVHGGHADRIRGGFDLGVLHEAAVDARLAVRARVYHPVFDRAGPLFDLPAEGFLVKRRGSFGICSGYFKMDDSRHRD